MSNIKICVLILATFFCFTNSIYSQNQVRWMSIEKAIEAQSNNPKKILVYLYTDWCGVCKKMDTTSYSDNDIAKYINENFYPVKFNAESRDEVLFDGKKYSSERIDGKRYHSLALKLSHGNLMYPTQVFLDEELNTIQSIIGYLSKEDMIKIGIYYGDDIYKDLSWNSYQRSITYDTNIIRNATF